VRKRQIGASDLHLTRIGLGAAAIGGGGWAFGWGPQDEGESIATVHAAVDAGINWIDTAAIYGLGRSEEVVARALRQLPPCRRPVVATKGGLDRNARGQVVHRLDPRFLREQVEASLVRLGVDTIDLYQVHWPALPPGTEAAEELEDGWAALVDLQRSGSIRALGVCNFTARQIELVSQIARPASVQIPYSLLRRDAAWTIMPCCRAGGPAVLAYSPMESGLLTGSMTRERVVRLRSDDWRSTSADFREPRLGAHLALAARLREIAAVEGRSAGELAIAWTLRNPDVTATIVGARSRRQIEQLAGAGEWNLPDAIVAELAQQSACPEQERVI
jgi:aryl-alcohol dehydrogenase-like predicted oxidoreductase